mmetsp:Transcript_13306/g.38372  ORF Transcript_13306/g.38372 Transcript_13306/m.38372 type:complete len:89 (+) Transcript_13306:626-892(+)
MDTGLPTVRCCTRAVGRSDQTRFRSHRQEIRRATPKSKKSTRYTQKSTICPPRASTQRKGTQTPHIASRYTMLHVTASAMVFSTPDMA